MNYLLAILISGALSFSAYNNVVRAIIISSSNQLPTLLTVLLAAVLVRLARGLPTMPLDKVNPRDALTATLAFRHLVRSYVQCLIVVGMAAVLNLATPVIKDNIMDVYLPLFVGIVLFFDLLVISVIYFLVSADIRISHIQADLNDQVTGVKTISAATETVAAVRNAFIKSGDNVSVKQT